MIDLVIERQGIYAEQARLGKKGPYLVEIIKASDVEGIKKEKIVIEYKIESKGLGVDSKPQNNEEEPARGIVPSGRWI